MQLAKSVVDKYPYSIFGKDQNGVWVFICASAEGAQANLIADSIATANGIETKVSASVEAEVVS